MSNKKFNVEVSALTNDYIATMPDDEMWATLRQVDDIVKKQGQGTRELEITLAYLQRESKIRLKRADEHAKYEAHLAQEEKKQEEYEKKLSVFNFDNLDYVRAHRLYSNNKYN